METKIEYEVLYNSTNITKDIQQDIISLRYTDRIENASDELEITLSDAEKKWQSLYYPQAGDELSVKIEGLDCGIFTIDEVSANFSIDGDLLSIKALSATINKSLRTTKFYAHENKTLREIVNTIAVSNNLKVKGNIPHVIFDRITQYQKTDLSYLRILSKRFGCIFSVRDQTIIFTDILELHQREEALNLFRKDLSSLSLTDKSTMTFNNASINFHNRKEKKNLSHVASENENAISTADTLILNERVENEEQAKIISKCALYRANSKKITGTLTMPGNVHLIAGNNLNLNGFGNMSGKYHIYESSHIVDGGGYTSTAEINKI